MDQQTITTGPGDYATAPRTNHPNDPRNDVDGLTDLADQAHQRIVERLAEGEAVCKVTARDIFNALPSHHQLDLLERLFGLGFLSGDHKRDATEQLIQDAGQVVHDFVEGNDHLRDSMLDDMEEEARREAMDGGDPNAAGWVA
jgi:hypothetical protein